MELRLRQKKNGAGRYARATHMTANKPTTASDLTPMTNNSNAQSSQIQKESQRVSYNGIRNAWPTSKSMAFWKGFQSCLTALILSARNHSAVKDCLTQAKKGKSKCEAKY